MAEEEKGKPICDPKAKRKVCTEKYGEKAYFEGTLKHMIKFAVNTKANTLGINKKVCFLGQTIVPCLLETNFFCNNVVTKK